MVLMVIVRSSSRGTPLTPGANSWLTESKRRVKEREMYDFSKGERAFRRAASYELCVCVCVCVCDMKAFKHS